MKSSKGADMSSPVPLTPVQCNVDANGEFKLNLRFLFYPDTPDVIFLEGKVLKDCKDNFDTI